MTGQISGTAECIRAHTQLLLPMSQSSSKVKLNVPEDLLATCMPPPTHLFHLPTVDRETNP